MIRHKEAILMTRTEFYERVIECNPLNIVNARELLAQHNMWVLLARLEKGRVIPESTIAEYPGIELVNSPLQAVNYWQSQCDKCATEHLPGSLIHDFMLSGIRMLESDYAPILALERKQAI